jgi:hypothetical protein
MKLSIAAALLCIALPAAELDRPFGNRTTPPTLDSVSPLGLSRGTTTELTLEGLNLAKASAIYFSEPGVTGKILRVKELPDGSDIRLGSNGTLSTVDLGPLPPRNQVTVEVDVSAKAEIGPVGFRLLTPLGTTPEGRVLIEPYYGESADREPNDSPDQAVETYLPAILTGTISKPGDVDYFKIQVKAGEQLTFENGAQMIGSSLQPVVAILAEDQALVKEFGTDGGMDTLWFAHRFEKAGTYYIRVSDYAQSGSGRNFYRIKVGNFPVVTRAYPLGVQVGQSRDEHLYGWNLKPNVVHIDGKPTAGYEDLLRLRPNHAFNEVKLAVGVEPEVEAARDNDTIEKAQPLPVPATVNGRLEKPGEFAFYRFTAKKGQKLILDVNARRLGSDLDSFLEVLDAKGSRIERATIRATWQTAITLADQTSSNTGLRILSWSDMKPGDFVMVGNEIIRIERLPKGPDEDVFFEQFGGQRLAFFDTTTEAHAIDKPVYKIQLHPPGTKFSNNGLPLVHLYYQNDDGGPGYSKDSLIHFIAPADGEYVVKLRDIQGLGGDNYAYRLTIREPRPDFRLAVNNRNPNVPVGGCIPITVTARRMDEFDGPIDVKIQDLPAGFSATPGLIQSGQVNSTMLLCASTNAKIDQAVPLKIVGVSGNITREANPDDRLKLISLMTPPDLKMTAETKEVTIAQGGTGKITVSIQRQNEFAGRVPIDVRNLPPHVQVPDVGLNGILLNENESRRTFTIEALDDAKPGEQWIYVGGDVETRSNLPSVYAAPEPIKLRIVAK